MKRALWILLATSLLIAGVVSWFASPHPDGLEKVAEDHGFIGRVREPLFRIMPDYTIPGLNGFRSNALAGVIGVAATFGFVMLAGKLAFRRRQRGDSSAPRPH